MNELPPHLRSAIDQAEAMVRDQRADHAAAGKERRCAAPPVGCGQPIKSLATAFRDQASRDEYEITRLCQACQDELFAPSADEVAAMAADTRNYGRCGVCGYYRPYEHVDVGVGIISGFDCCPDELYQQIPRCAKTSATGQCGLRQDHVYDCEFPAPKEDPCPQP